MLKGTKVTCTDYQKVIAILLQRIGQRAIKITLDELALAPLSIRRADHRGNLFFGLDMSNLLDLEKGSGK